MPTYDGISPPCFEDALHEAVGYTQNTLDAMPQSLCDISGHLNAAQGKFLRAGLLIASAMCGQYDNRRVIPLASAVEILHLGSLVHDDIIDNADTRRGLESLPKKFGQTAAVFTGDYLFTIVFSLLSKHNRESMEDVARAVQAICLGEILQNRYRYCTDMSLTRYIRIVTRKTGALFACSMYSGAKEGGLDETTCRILSRAGGYAGVMFQIIDDCLDLSAKNPEKPAFKDITEGVTTLPVLFALKSSPGLARRLRDAVSAGDTRLAADCVIKAGGLERAQAVAHYYYQKAVRQLEKIPDSAGRQALDTLFEKCIKREK